LLRYVILPEQRTISLKDPDQLPHAAIPPLPPPRTVTNPEPQAGTYPISLDEAIRVALINAKVVRALNGFTAVATNNTIYDTAIVNTTIDQAQARFDPVLSEQATWSHTDTPQAILNPFDPTRAIITGTSSDAFNNQFGLTKTNVLGGQWALTRSDTDTRFGAGSGFPLNPQERGATALSYTQPFLQGGGFHVNTAPIVLARLDTERSYFQFKDSVQELVRGTIEAYWNLVLARTVVWARRIQVEQSKEAYERARARMQAQLADVRDVAQARVTYGQFRAALIAAEADVLAREGALRNLLFLPPEDGRQLVPVSVPTDRRLGRDWAALTRLVEARRPDVIELKLVLEADQVRLLQAQNQALPQLNASALYRWNGLSGVAPGGEHVGSGAGQFTDWSLGLNFSVPLGLRQGRAQVRQQDLIVARDRADLEQAVHAALNDVTFTLRNLDSSFEQYLAFKETRTAALENLRVQIAEFRAGRTIYLNVLQALNDWGNSVTSEAQELINYNVGLANLERQTGTNLETHGLVLFEERLKAAGPLGLCGPKRCYPAAIRPGGDPKGYPPTDEPGENFFDLTAPSLRDSTTPERLPRLDMPRPLPPDEKP
jgi:outer membrane protein TolC